MRLALAVASFLLLVILGLAFHTHTSPGWERHQQAYFDHARRQAQTDAGRAALAGRGARIEQIVVTAFGATRVDRCGTCHIAGDDPRFEKHPHPLKTHPYSAALGDTHKQGKWERRHKFHDFGCTLCHDGQGRGLTSQDSHGEDRHWPAPLLGYAPRRGLRQESRPELEGKQFMEANCARCHAEENFPGTATVQKGRRLFFSNGCYGCHRIEGVSDGAPGPDLTAAGKSFRVDYLWESIADPRANASASTMPQFNLAGDQVQALVIFLKSRQGGEHAGTEVERFRARQLKRAQRAAGASGSTDSQPGRPGVLRAQNAAGSSTASDAIAPVASGPLSVTPPGRKLVADRACLACHKLGVPDGGIAPDLSHEGLIREAGWLFDHFLDPKSQIADSVMPSFRFTGGEFKALTAYLASLRTSPSLADAADTYKTLCMRCHGEKGDGRGPNANYLDPYPRDLTSAAYLHSLTPRRLLHAIQRGVAGASMPALEEVLSAAQAKAVLEYVESTYTKAVRRELKPRGMPEANPVAASAESVARGENGFARRCVNCHGRKADGRGPNSPAIGPRPRNLRNSVFVESISGARLFESILYGVPGTVMPSWIDSGLSHSDAGDLVNFIRGLGPQVAGRRAGKRDGPLAPR